MVLSVATREPGWCDGGTEAGQDLRLNHGASFLSGLDSGTSPLSIGSGVRDGVGSPMLVQVSAGLSVTVNTGYCKIQGSSAANAGAYDVTVDTVATLTCNAADTVNSRIDSVCVSVVDPGSGPAGAVQIITGTPASSPTAPALPSNSLLLCNITVPVNAVALAGGNLSDQRQFLAAAGGIKPYLSSSKWPTTGGSAMYLHDIATGRLKRYKPGTGVVAPSVAAFAPAFGAPGSVTATNTTPQTATSTTVTVDGVTAAEVTISWKLISTTSTTAGNACTVSITRNGSIIASLVKVARANNDTIDGGSFTFPDQSPPAGATTYALTIVTQGAGQFSLNSGNLAVKALSP